MRTKTPYYDFTSLYPYVQKKYNVEKCADIEIDNVFGLIKCKVLAPTNLLFPVRMDKLTFPLCRTCVEELCDKCTHNDEQQALYDTWTSVEVHKAITHGYKILTVYEIYHYSDSRKIFDMYVDTFMKIKQESSGVPKHCLDTNGNIDNNKLQKYVLRKTKQFGISQQPSF